MLGLWKAWECGFRLKIFGIRVIDNCCFIAALAQLLIKIIYLTICGRTNQISFLWTFSRSSVISGIHQSTIHFLLPSFSWGKIKVFTGAYEINFWNNSIIHWHSFCARNSSLACLKLQKNNSTAATWGYRLHPIPPCNCSVHKSLHLSAHKWQRGHYIAEHLTDW